MEIVGVVSDIRHESLESKYESEIYLPYGRISTAEMQVVVQSDLDTAAVGSAVLDVLRQMDPELAASQVVALSDLLWESVAQPRFNTALLSILALCAVLLAAAGTYGVVAYTVSQRTAEIGVRMALGADAGSTVRMIVQQALAIVAVGTVIGAIGALGTSRLLSRVLYDVQPTDPAHLPRRLGSRAPHRHSGRLDAGPPCQPHRPGLGPAQRVGATSRERLARRPLDLRPPGRAPWLRLDRRDQSPPAL